MEECVFKINKNRNIILKYSRELPEYNKGSALDGAISLYKQGKTLDLNIGYSKDGRPIIDVYKD